MVIVSFSGITAVIEDHVWRCEDSSLLRLLETTISPDGPSGADPNPDLTVAQAAVSAYNGEIIYADDADYEEGMVY